jgi:hypothetical protein
VTEESVEQVAAVDGLYGPPLSSNVENITIDSTSLKITILTAYQSAG